MRVFDRHWLMEGVAREMRRRASTSARYNGIMTEFNRKLLTSCTADHVSTGTRLIFTYDEGHHSSGWWKNPDYERCWHLSLSFFDPLSGEHVPKDVKRTSEWLIAFYGEARRFLWAESPYSAHGKTADVWHYRVFCDPAWQPIIPRGEVYSKEFTEAGWQSYSDLSSAHARALQELEPLPGEQ
jgi:hypothetical protein